MRILLLLLLASPAMAAAPKIDELSVKPNAKTSEVEIAISVTKAGGNCDARIDFGDGRGRTVDFGLATHRTLKYTYKAAGNYKVSVKGTGKAPCDGAKEAPIRVAGTPAASKKAETKKAETKKAEKKKAAKKAARAKKEEPK